MAPSIFLYSTEVVGFSCESICRAGTSRSRDPAREKGKSCPGGEIERPGRGRRRPKGTTVGGRVGVGRTGGLACCFVSDYFCMECTSRVEGIERHSCVCNLLGGGRTTGCELTRSVGRYRSSPSRIAVDLCSIGNENALRQTKTETVSNRHVRQQPVSRPSCRSDALSHSPSAARPG